MAVREAEMTSVQPHEHDDRGHDRLVIIAWSGDLDKVWPQMILATTGAAMGMDTTIFFTFWGLFSLVKDDVHLTGENWMQKMVAMMDRPGVEHSSSAR
jgi:peroxiredoxin family protein